MKKSSFVPALFLLPLTVALPVPALAAGGKSSKQHEQARTTKLAAEEAARNEAESETQPGKTEVAGEKKKVWTRPVRHKQTMPPAPNLGGARSAKKGE